MVKELILGAGIEQKIFIIRGQRVMLSSHLAELYGVEAKVLIQAVKRNIERFPRDFMFQLTWEEAHSLRSQFVTLEDKVGESSKKRKTSKISPVCFYGTRCGYVVERLAKQACDSCEHCHYANLCKAEKFSFNA